MLDDVQSPWLTVIFEIELANMLYSLFTGLIIDVFGDLRDQLEQARQDFESKCFICGTGKEYVDATPHSFD